ncbi:MAG TPA: ankyrin repeat domain-containing protein [Opitutales bacterium]|nr:ankyrin repeat domain-containing protein [Opitutales bacterium]
MRALNAQLLQAAADGGLADVRRLLMIGVDPEIHNAHRQTPLHLAAAGGHTAIVDLLLTRRITANVRAQDEHGQTPLHLAIAGGHTDAVRLLLAHRADSNAIGEHGITPLHLAAARGYLAIADLLLEHGADVNAVDENKDTPLHLAVKGSSEVAAEDAGAEAGNYVGTVQLLLKRGANSNLLNREYKGPHLLTGDPAIRKCIEEMDADCIDGQETASAVTSLIRVPECVEDAFSALLNGRPAAMITQAHQQPWRRELPADFVVTLDNVRAWIEGGSFRADARNRNYLSILHVAAGGGHLDAVRALLDAGAVIDSRDQSEFTPLHYAAYHGHIQVVLELLMRGADVNAVGVNGSIPLHMLSASTVAVDLGSIAQLLLEYGANPIGPNRNNLVPANLARTNQMWEFFAGVVKPFTDLHRAAYAGDHEAFIEALDAAGAEVAARDSGNFAALHYAAFMGHIGAVEALLDRGALVNATGWNGMTPLHAAVAGGQLDGVHFLLQRQADPTLQNRRGYRPLDLVRPQDDAMRAMLEEAVEHWNRRLATTTTTTTTTAPATVDALENVTPALNEVLIHRDLGHQGPQPESVD